MLQDNTPHSGSLTASLPQSNETDVFERTLSFDPTNGQFTFGSSTLDSTEVFRIPLTAAQTIVINAAPGIEFAPTPFKELRIKKSGSFGTPSVAPTLNRIEIPVTDLPTASGVLGFVLIVQLTGSPTPVHRIETPPFLVTLDQPFPEPDLTLSYDPDSGVFAFTENGVTPPGSITLEKGLIILRLHDGTSSPPSSIHVSLVPASAGIVFANTPVMPLSLAFTRLSDTEITITRDFISGTGFNVSFGVDVPIGGGQTCTVYSPDPIIVDKQIGGSG